MPRYVIAGEVNGKPIKVQIDGSTAEGSLQQAKKLLRETGLHGDLDGLAVVQSYPERSGAFSVFLAEGGGKVWDGQAMEQEIPPGETPTGEVRRQ